LKTAYLLLLLFSNLIFSQKSLEYLRKYINIDTKKNTKEGVLFFKKVFEENNIEYKIIENGENPSILAKIDGSDKNLVPFLLTHHIDCVQEASQLKEYENYLEGNCLLDDKSLGVSQLISFLEANKKKPKRGIYFLAVSNEENGGKEGINYVIEKGFLPEISFVLGEGGKAASATDKKLSLSISNTDKGALWLEIEISLPGGHSASGDDNIIRNYLNKIFSLPKGFPFYGKLKELQDFLSWYKYAFPRNRELPKSYEEVEGGDKIFVSTTLSITKIETDGGKNMLPSKLIFCLDIRTADAESHKKVMDYLKKEFEGAKITKILEVYPSKTTPSDNIYFKKLLKILKEIYPNLPIGPSINPGFSDLNYLREKGIPSFGFSPFFLNYYHFSTIHKKGERMPKERFLEGVELMKEVVLKLCEE